MEDKKLVYEKFSNLKMESPTSMFFNGVRRTVSDRQVLRRLTHGIGLPNVSFSKNLYTLNPSVWSSICEQTMKSESSVEFLASKTAIVDNESGEIIGITESTDVSELFKYCKDLSKKLEMNYDSDIVNGSFYIRLSNGNIGLWISYYPDNDWLEVKSFLYKDDNLFINPYPIVSTEIADSSFDVLLNAEMLKSNCDYEVSVNYHYNPFLDRLGNIEISVAEMKWFLKNDLGIKYSENLSAFDIAAENDDFDNKSTSALTSILGMLDKFQRIALYSPDLKKEITFSTPAENYYELLSCLSSKSLKYWRSLSYFIEEVSSSRLNYSQIMDENNKEEDGVL